MEQTAKYNLHLKPKNIHINKHKIKAFGHYMNCIFIRKGVPARHHQLFYVCNSKQNIWGYYIHLLWLFHTASIIPHQQTPSRLLPANKYCWLWEENRSHSAFSEFKYDFWRIILLRSIKSSLISYAMWLHIYVST